MLIQSKHLLGARVISIHTGQPVGELGEPIINPNKFSVEGFFVTGNWQQKYNEPVALLSQDIREITAQRALINSVDEITPLSELVRLNEVIKIKYTLIGKPVRTESKKRLGRVDDYVINSLGYSIQKIYVKQSVFKSMSLHSLVIDRAQITEINDKYVIVSDATLAKPAPEVAPAA